MECWTIESCCHQAIPIARAKCSRSDATGRARQWQLLRQNHKRSIINLMHEQGPRPGRTHWHDSTPHADIWVAAWEAYGVDYDDMPCSTITGNRTKPSIRPYIINGTGHIDQADPQKPIWTRSDCLLAAGTAFSNVRHPCACSSDVHPPRRPQSRFRRTMFRLFIREMSCSCGRFILEASEGEKTWVYGKVSV